MLIKIYWNCLKAFKISKPDIHNIKSQKSYTIFYFVRPDAISFINLTRLNLILQHVAFLDVLEREGGALEGELLNKFGALRAKFIKCDISDVEQLSAAYTQVLDKYRRLDAVINNAAVICEEEGFYKKTVDINFVSICFELLVSLNYIDN